MSSNLNGFADLFRATKRPMTLKGSAMIDEPKRSPRISQKI